MEQPDLPHLSVCGCNLLSVANEMNWINHEYSAGLKLRMPPCLFSFPAHLECLRKNTFLGGHLECLHHRKFKPATWTFFWALRGILSAHDYLHIWKPCRYDIKG